jgi:hypothetical protein
MSFKVGVVGLVGFFVLVILGPLTVFTPHLSRSKRRGLSEYGTLATVYVADFDEKCIRGGMKQKEILGIQDIQSLADVASSYSVVREMRPVPFTLNDVIQLVIGTTLPIVPFCYLRLCQ